MFSTLPWLLLGAVLLDLSVGEVPSRLHPVVWMGKMISFFQSRLPCRTPKTSFFSGLILSISLPLIWAWLAWITVFFLDGFFRFLISLILLKSVFSLRCLGTAALKLRDFLEQGDLKAARGSLKSLCGRPSKGLEEQALITASVESLAENTCDSFIAPLFYFVFFGLPGAFFYRSVNTMDAMIAYHGEFEYFGKATAYLDDFLNWIPARLTAVLFLFAGFLKNMPIKKSLHICFRDARKTESPNAGWPMAVMAGLLGIELSKPGYYRLGDNVREINRSQIDEAWGIVFLSSILFLLFLVLTL